FPATGMVVPNTRGLGMDDTGYACMPLFHSNAMFLGFQPALHVCGGLAVRERFSASSFVPDVFRHGVTFWNYVGEPVHYVLGAIEKQYGGAVAPIPAAGTEEPPQPPPRAGGAGRAPPPP